MKIEAGKRYVKRNGWLTGCMIFDPSQRSPLQWRDPETGYSCTDEGLCFLGEDQENPHDLLRVAPAFCCMTDIDETFDDNRLPPTVRDAVESVALAAVSDGDAYDIAALDALAEVRRAKSLWPGPANSMHEQFAVLDEEIDELLDATGVERLSVLMAARGRLWAYVKVNQKRRDLAAARKEAIQVAAMALRFAAECCDETVGRR